MKKFLKFLIFLIVLAIIIYGGYLFIGRNRVSEPETETTKSSKKQVDPEITGADQDLIEDYISKIYLGIGLVDEENVLPEFDNINAAPDDWILNCMYLSLANDSETNIFSEESVEAVKIELFGDKLTKELKLEDSYGNIGKDENGDYVLSFRSFEPDYLNYYIIDKIAVNKKNDNIEVTLVEYRTNSLIGEETEIKVHNLESEEVLFTQEVLEMEEEGLSESDNKIIEFVENNKEKFTTVKVFLEKQNDQYYVMAVER